MKAEDIIDALDGIDECHLRDADRMRNGNKNSLKVILRYASLAACFCLIFGLAVVMFSENGQAVRESMAGAVISDDASGQIPQETDGWHEDLSGKYYIRNGSRVTGWVDDIPEHEGKIFYFDESGTMAVGQKTIEGTEYYFDDDGVLIP